MSTARFLAVLTCTAGLACALPSGAAAQSASDIATFLAGGAVALAAHETGHVVLDLSVGVTPGLKKVTFGPLPFFAITHRPVSPGREFAISSAGFWVQHAASELILTARPRLRQDHAPFLKGILAFNVLASAAYAGAAVARAGPPERDTRGMAVSAGIPEPIVGLSILAPAALDAARYYRAGNRWLTWGSRAAKVGGALMIVRALD